MQNIVSLSFSTKAFAAYEEISRKFGFTVQGALLRGCIKRWIEDGCPSEILRRTGRTGNYKTVSVALEDDAYEVVTDYARRNGLKTTEVLRGAVVYTLAKHGMTIPFEDPSPEWFL